MPQDYLNYDADKSLSAFDRTHRFVANYLYEIPILGLLKKNAFTKAVFGGFQFPVLRFSIRSAIYDSNGC